MDIFLFPQREVVLQIGSFGIRWYGVLWVLAFWLVWWLVPKLQKYRGLTLSREKWDQLIAWGIVGAFVGGRVGYALFYEPQYFLQHPVALFAVWHGGMASHGGFIGAALAVWLVVRSWGQPQETLFKIADILTVPLALALALGRTGNFINNELFGSNPVAIIKELVTAAACYLVLTRSPAILRSSMQKPGMIFVLFLLLYSVLRFAIEPLRADPWAHTWGLTRGQLLTLPLLLIAVLLWIWVQKPQLLSRKRIKP